MKNKVKKAPAPIGTIKIKAISVSLVGKEPLARTVYQAKEGDPSKILQFNWMTADHLIPENWDKHVVALLNPRGSV